MDIYTTVANVRQITGITTEEIPDSDISNLIGITDKLIDSLTDTTFTQSSITEYYDGGDFDGSVTAIFLCQSPIGTVTSVKVGGKTQVEDTDYWVYIESNKIIFDEIVEVSNKVIEVTYTYGYGSTSAEAILIGGASAMLTSSLCFTRMGKGIEQSQMYWKRGLEMLESLKNRLTLRWT